MNKLNEDKYKSIIVLVTAKTCFYCEKFKKDIWNNVKTYIQKKNKSKILHIELQNTSSLPSIINYHPELSSFIGWFPTLLLFPIKLWKNYKSNLKGSVYNGEFVNTNLNKENKNKIKLKDNGKFDYNSIVNWYDNNLNNNIIFRESHNYKNIVKDRNKNNKNTSFIIKNINKDKFNTNNLNLNTKFRQCRIIY